MANYKSIVDIESVAEATESMNVLVEDAGSLKKVPAGGMIGGGSGNFCFIDGVEVAAPPKASQATFPNANFTASMSYGELKELYQNKELAGIIIRFFMNDSSVYYIFADAIGLDNSVNVIYMHGYLALQDVHGDIFYHSDGRINYETDAVTES